MLNTAGAVVFVLAFLGLWLFMLVLVPLAIWLIITLARWSGLDAPRDYSNSDDVTVFRSGL